MDWHVRETFKHLSIWFPQFHVGASVSHSAAPPLFLPRYDLRARSCASCSCHRRSVVRAPLSLYIVAATSVQPSASGAHPTLHPIAPNCSHGGTQLLSFD